MKSIIIYSTTDGHTKKISEFIMSNSYRNKFDIASIDEASNINLNNYDLIVIGASIRYGKHNKKFYKYINKNLNIINKKKNAFFSVNVVARKLEKSTVKSNPYIIKFLKKTSWLPMRIDVFAGKVDYPNYNFVNKNVIRFIMFVTNGPTNINESYEFTNWDKIRSFAKELDNF